MTFSDANSEDDIQESEESSEEELPPPPKVVKKPTARRGKKGIQVTSGSGAGREGNSDKKGMDDVRRRAALLEAASKEDL
jgi:hypothetical protein